MLKCLTTYYNLNQQTHPILLKSQYYNTPSSTCFASHWPIIRQHTVVQNSTMEHGTQAAPITVSSAQLDRLRKYYVMSFWQLHAETIKFLFCTVVCSLVMDQCGLKHLESAVL